LARGAIDAQLASKRREAVVESDQTGFRRGALRRLRRRVRRGVAAGTAAVFVSKDFKITGTV
jgi:hypothetical protein